MAFTAAANPINTPLLAVIFSSDGPLQVYSGTISRGVTADFEIFGEITGYLSQTSRRKAQIHSPRKM